MDYAPRVLVLQRHSDLISPVGFAAPRARSTVLPTSGGQASRGYRHQCASKFPPAANSATYPGAPAASGLTA